MRSILAGLLALGLVSAWAAPARADSVLTDTYWGGDPVGTGDADRIGTSRFEIDKITVSASGNKLTVKVYTNFVNGGAGSSVGAKLGDLFFSTDGWAATGTGPQYTADNWGSTGHEDWEFAVTLDDYTGWNYDSTSATNRIGVASGTATLYQIGNNTTYVDGNAGAHASLTDGAIVLSDYYWNSGYRGLQEVRYSAAGDTGETVIDSAGTWKVLQDGSGAYYLEYVITSSAVATAFYNGQLGVHWAMNCGNDTISGLVPVPEPATIGLMAAGVALLGIRARRKRSVPTA